MKLFAPSAATAGYAVTLVTLTLKRGVQRFWFRGSFLDHRNQRNQRNRIAHCCPCSGSPVRLFGDQALRHLPTTEMRPTMQPTNAGLCAPIRSKPRCGQAHDIEIFGRREVAQ